ncbi:MAG: hypothetical protein JW990_14670 [Thermoleophilia bacterium]|nr:hypothetical protein [Thermoleophilia bacterium]
MKMPSPKAHWKTPEMVVLTRGRPEENVLQGCKVDGASGSGSQGVTYADCKAADQEHNRCRQSCSSRWQS